MGCDGNWSGMCMQDSLPTCVPYHTVVLAFRSLCASILQSDNMCVLEEVRLHAVLEGVSRGVDNRVSAINIDGAACRCVT